MGTYDTSFEPFLTVKNEYRTYFSRKLEKNFFFRLFWQKIPPPFSTLGLKNWKNFKFWFRTSRTNFKISFLSCFQIFRSFWAVFYKNCIFSTFFIKNFDKILLIEAPNIEEKIFRPLFSRDFLDLFCASDLIIQLVFNRNRYFIIFLFILSISNEINIYSDTVGIKCWVQTALKFGFRDILYLVKLNFCFRFLSSSFRVLF